ncbi:hypothetical protein MINTM008_01290 [Mycobacterium intracellulare]|nr:AAA domain protein [Mycobacterium intracellulare MIN_061107_1834]BCO60177.1 hypothetical protein MINTM006_01270 [Mycobacterium intracellulare]BCO70794.1 hypothetical protein MINTM008_01290 [Mycobacterium intracellulare]BCO76346.1 hypothetical protein MINTM009_01280 [Mycobacterium intracellulare]BCP18339.1 hypothetical protein MINTM023_01280 [Mycobacterium intracellulare]
MPTSHDNSAAVTAEETSNSDDDCGLLPHKLRQPGIPRDVLRRPRLDALFDRLFNQCPAVLVSAAPGTGKTVQAQLYASHLDQPTAWITLDTSHTAPLRLMNGIAEALRGMRDDNPPAERPTFHLEATLEEVAALTAGAIPPQPALLVIDECDYLDSSVDAQAALETFLEYSPSQLRVLLLSRADLTGPLQLRLFDGRIGLVNDTELRLSTQECAQLGGLIGATAEHSARVHEATGGWTAGAVFSLRYGLPEERVVQDLPSVIMNQVLSDLPASEQQFLLDMSVPDVLTRETAAALCGGGAHALWDAIRARHLPATSMTDTTVVFHSLFRTFLHRQLLARDTQRHVELIRRYARYLVSRRHPEEATELYLAIDELGQAQTTAEMAVGELCLRSDWDTFLRWAQRLGQERVQASPQLLAAHVRALFGQRRFDETVTLIRALDRRGLLRAAMEADKALLATAAWALQADPSEARRLLDRYEGDYRADVVLFMLQVSTELSPAVPPLGNDWGDVERIMSWGLLLQGRIGELAAFVPGDPHADVVNPNVILASIFAGRIDEARALWDRVPLEIRDRPQSHFIEALLLLSEGEPEHAFAAIQVALTDSRKTTFFLFPAYEMISGYILLQLGRDEDAIAVLQDGIERTGASGQTALLEWGQTFLGLALLTGDDAEAARPLLNECVRSMSRAHRRLFLPFAAACLSEAEARCGDMEAAHEAADLAYRTAAMTGSFLTLVLALRSFADIVKREDELDPSRMRWHRVVLAPSARPPRNPCAVGNVRVALQPFGSDRDIWVNGEPQKVGRMKIIELMALLVLHPDGIDRARLQSMLFPEASLRNGGNHFRQIAFKFRGITGLSLDRRDGNLVGLPTDTAVDAADVRFEELLRTASWVTGQERALRLHSALDLACGPYLGGSNLTWAEERRHHLDVVQEEARLELTRLLLELGQPEQARQQCEALLALNRYSDPAYRLLVQIERTIGSESSALAAYRRAVSALQELGLEPGDARRLLEAAPAAPGRPVRSRADIADPRRRSLIPR